jgi:long-chain acyl-CoA synthetase
MAKPGLFIAVVLLTVALAAPVLHAAEVAGVRMEEQIKVSGSDLVLNGAGVRTKLFFKVYAAALYAPKKTTSAATLIDSREPRRLVMHMLRDLDADSLFNALLEGLRNNHSESELAKLKPDIDQFERLMRGIGNAKTGDIIGIDFSVDGVSISFNGQPRGDIASEAFARALLKVWLGDKPADGDLKRALLGS